MILSAPLLRWMNTPEEVFGDSVTYLKVYFGGVLFNVIYNMAATTFVGQNYGAGKKERVKKALWVTVPPMVVLLVSLCLFRIVWIQFILPFFTTIDGIFMIYPVSWALGTVLMILYTWKGKWLNQH